MGYFSKTGMKYWDDFERRAAETIQSIKSGRIPNPRRISIHITERCNMACAYCNEYKKKNTLPLELAKKLLVEYSEMGGGILHITGGEPTTVPYLADFLLLSRGYENINIHLNSNLYNIFPIKKALSEVKRLKVSLDSSSQQQFNLLTGKKDAFQRVCGNLDFIHNEAPNIITSITYTVNRQNFRDIPAFLEMYYKRWPNFYAVFFSSYKGKQECFAMIAAEIEEMFSIIVPRMKGLTEKNNDNETRFLFENSHNPDTFKREDRFPINKVLPCYLQLSEFVIDSNGDLYNCSHLFRDGASGTGYNITDGHLSELFVKSKKAIKKYPLSHHCLYGCNNKLVIFNRTINKELSCPPKSAGLKK